MDIAEKESLKAAQEALSNNDMVGAWNSINKIAIESSDLEIIEFATMLAVKKKNYKYVIDILNHALKLYPECARIHNNIANAYHKSLNSNLALKHLYFAVNLEPNYAEALNNIANIYHNTGQVDKAIEFYSKAIRIRPQYYEAHYNLAISLSKKERYVQAIAHYNQSGILLENNPTSWLNVGMCHFALEEYQNAIKFLKKYCEYDNNHEQACIHLASAYLYTNNYNDSLTWSNIALTINPNNPELHHNVAILLLKEKDYKKALEHFERSLSLNSNNVTAEHMVAAIKKENIATSSYKYVNSLFTQYASYYDTNMQKDLEYKAPSILREAVGNIIIEQNLKINTAIEIGCGTGLAGILFRDTNKFFIGVDLCFAMLEIAKSKQVYDAVAAYDMKDKLPGNSDLVICADVLNYCGDLSSIFNNISECLFDNGIFCFSTEEYCDGSEPYQLQITGRFSHSNEYILDLSKSHGFKVLYNNQAAIRKNGNVDVLGRIYVLQKT